MYVAVTGFSLRGMCGLSPPLPRFSPLAPSKIESQESYTRRHISPATPSHIRIRDGRKGEYDTPWHQREKLSRISALCVLLSGARRGMRSQIPAQKMAPPRLEGYRGKRGRRSELTLKPFFIEWQRPERSVPLYNRFPAGVEALAVKGKDPELNRGCAPSPPARLQRVDKCYHQQRRRI